MPRLYPPDLNDDPLINPPKEPSPAVAKAIDVLSWALPTLAAVLATIGGVGALYNANTLAAICSIISGIVGALGVIATGQASKIRDNKLAVVCAVANLATRMADHENSSHPMGYH